MSEILSQDEVKALLTEIKHTKPTDEDKRKEVNAYDFKHPDRISKDQHRALRTIHSNFAKTFGTYLSTKLRTTVDISVLSIDQLSYSEFTMTIASPSCIYSVVVGNSEGSIVLEFAPELVFFTIDRLLGGRGESVSTIREITIIEENILKKIANESIMQLEDAWRNVMVLGLEMSGFDTNPQFVQVAPASEPCVVMSFSVKIQNFSSIITICFPFFVLEPIMQRLNVQGWLTAKQQDKAKETAIIVRDKLEATPLSLVAKMDATELKLSQIRNLEIGDVLLFDKKMNSKFDVQLAGKTKFLATPGVYNKKLSLRITDIIQKTVDVKNGKR